MYEGKQGEKLMTCDAVLEDKSWAFWLDLLKSLGIMVFSLTFARLIKSRTAKLRMPTESQQKKIVMTNIAVA